MKNLYLIGADFIITCNEHFEIIKNGGILFNEEKIVKIGDYNKLKDKAINSRFYKSCVITPALINSHIHFEFSSNNSTLKYGNFGEWLDSVMIHRDSLFANDSSIKEAIKETLRSGIGSVGAISSNGFDLEALSSSPLKVMFFNEIMGTTNIEKIKDSFDLRLKKSKMLENVNFKSAIALHSPYSLHSDLAEYAIDRAIKEKMLLSVHFMESKEELMWLDYKKGYFNNFFTKYFNDSAKPFYTKKRFIEMFSSCEGFFVHCLYLNNDDFEMLSRLNIDIISAPRSNRLLNNRYFDFFKAKDYKFPLIIATDGKSSNNSLSLLDEARVALFAYEKFDINNLAKEIILSMTARPAKRLGFNNGILEKNKASDFAIFNIRDIATSSQIALNFILHSKNVEDLYINGKRIDIEKY
ncbi:aminofutalosine deaminase family hydrolase [Helicobacter sp. MIT 14-3879]|uniref:aminofutalosine deaminase family hydrolase n=1 Tax=Helicobacter sp. MIT 14-3879 TaxID=2040649 RepID=UPI000E1F5CAF|nr:aminofutalosine deaminase family hydrolase [Helicobacter sp. MIT 14-3879]RDU63126.1 metal-dependent hydrolase [Helicobacter sp. MIT 14-3879]